MPLGSDADSLPSSLPLPFLAHFQTLARPSSSQLDVFLRLLHQRLRRSPDFCMLDPLPEAMLLDQSAGEAGKKALRAIVAILGAHEIGTLPKAHFTSVMLILAVRSGSSPSEDPLQKAIARIFRFSVSSAEHPPALLYLLGIIYANDSFALVCDLYRMEDWSVASTDLAASILETLPRPSIVHLLEQLAEIVDGKKSLSHYMSLVEACSYLDNADWTSCLLLAHDKIVQHGYPSAECLRFSTQLRDLVVRRGSLGGLAPDPASASTGKIEDLQWAINNICSNLTRAMVNLDGSPAPPSLETVCGIFSVVRGLAVVPGRQVEVTLQCVERFVAKIGSATRDYFEKCIEFAAEILLDQESVHVASCSAIWKGLCKCSQNSDENFYALLVLWSQSRDPIALFDHSFLASIDFRRDFWQNSALVFLEKLGEILNKESADGDAPSLLPSGSTQTASFRELLSQTYLLTSASIKLRFSSVDLGPAFFVQEHWDLILDVFALCSVYLVQSGTKTWRQLASDYSSSAPWIKYGNTSEHRTLCAQIYWRWVNHPAASSELLVFHNDVLFAAGLQELFERETWSHPRLLLSIFSLSTGLAISDAECGPRRVIELTVGGVESLSEYKKASIWSHAIAAISKNIDDSARGDYADGEYLSMVWSFARKVPSIFPVQVCERLLEVSANTHPVSLLLLVDAAHVVHHFRPLSLVDRFDLLVDRFGSQSSQSLAPEGQAIIDEEDATWLLNRLTSVALAKNDLSFVKSGYTDGLLCALLAGIESEGAIELFAIQLCQCLEGQSQGQSSVFYYFICKCFQQIFHRLDSRLAFTWNTIDGMIKCILRINFPDLPREPTFLLEAPAASSGKACVLKLKRSADIGSVRLLLRALRVALKFPGMVVRAVATITSLAENPYVLNISEPLELEDFFALEHLTRYSLFRHPLFKSEL